MTRIHPSSLHGLSKYAITNPVKSFLQIPAFEKLVDGVEYHCPPITILLLELLRINLLELVK
jgi:hypothetical protein